MALRRSHCYGNVLRQSRAAARFSQPSILPLFPMVSCSPPSVVPSRPDYRELISYRSYATEQPSDDQQKPVVEPKSNREKVKLLVKEYGPVGFAFYMGVSFTSLGTCYVLVSNGLDVERVLTYLNVTTSGTSKGASTFAIAYVLHKVLLPLRAAVTVGGLPLVVRRLRSMGWMKPKNKS
ncbi:protein FAM210B, mitochondrial-like [Halichondria panicea]|uniref:protein FAM210B, mitochondrial-like n=1 Tax=Halichondria panicea TaxID=6063 RepID=UPI00312BA7E6